MIFASIFGRSQIEIPCTVEIENSAEFLHAHVELDGDYDICAGDEVQVLDAPEAPPRGERIIVQRKALVTRVGALERLWVMLAGNLELTELYEVSFTERRTL